MPHRLVLIDGTNYAFRAFHAIPPLTNSRGFPTNALHGFANMLVLYLTKERPDYLAVVFDAPGPTFRKKKYEAYKAQRKEIPEDLRAQIPYFKRLTETLNIAFLELEGYEADDIIATIVRRHADADLDVSIISMDKDLVQLVNERVTMIDTLRNKRYDPEAVIKKWGVPPAQIRDLLALQGDTSDNIPGVPGIGPKRAKALLEQFGSVENLLANLDQVSNKRMRDLLTTHADQARLSLELVTLCEEVPVDTALDRFVPREPDKEACTALFRELEFNRLLKAFGSSEQADEGLRIRPLSGADDVEAFEAEAGKATEIAVVFHGAPTRLARPDALAVATSASTIWELDLKPMRASGSDEWVNRFRRTLEDPAMTVLAHDAKTALNQAAALGWTDFHVEEDTQILAWLINPSRSGQALAPLARTLLGIEHSANVATRASEEAAIIVRLFKELAPRLDQTGMTSLYRTLEIPLLPIVARMERWGIRLDTEHFRAISKEYEGRMADLEARITALAGQPFNPASAKQLRVILFDRLGLPIVKKTKTGPSTDSSVLEKLARDHELPRLIVQWRSLAKLKGTYLDALPRLIDPRTSRIHTTFSLTATATGRLSSSDPNLQNIPVRGEEGRRIREAFVPEPGFVFLSADYSQIELRLLAHLSGDEALIQAFQEGKDIHAATAAQLFGVDPGLVTKEMRRSAKAINFGILYGMGAHRLAGDLGITRKEADRYIEHYFERYQGVRAFLDRTIKRARQDGYVSTMSGRRRFIPDIHAKNFNVRQGAERIAVNTPIQGSAADIIKKAMIDVSHALDAHASDTRMLLQVHDELLFEVPEDDVAEIREIVRTSMEGAAALRVPLLVDIGVGRNWAEAH